MKTQVSEKTCDSFLRSLLLSNNHFYSPGLLFKIFSSGLLFKMSSTANDVKQSPVDLSKPMNDLEWVNLMDEIDRATGVQETQLEKMKRKVREEPLIPIGKKLMCNFFTCFQPILCLSLLYRMPGDCNMSYDGTPCNDEERW